MEGKNQCLFFPWPDWSNILAVYDIWVPTLTVDLNSKSNVIFWQILQKYNQSLLLDTDLYYCNLRSDKDGLLSGRGNRLFTKTSGLAAQPTWAPAEWVTVSFPLETNRSVSEADHSRWCPCLYVWSFNFTLPFSFSAFAGNAMFRLYILPLDLIVKTDDVEWRRVKNFEVKRICCYEY